MFKDDYRKELDNISASEKFKKDTISLMKERQAELQQSNTETKVIKFNIKPYRKIAASVAVMLLAAAIFAYSQSDFAISADNAAEAESYLEQSTEYNTTDKDSEYDSLPANIAGNEKKMRVYTINDAKPLEQPDLEGFAKKGVTFSHDGGGGMGYEAYLYYEDDDLTTNNVYNTAVTFDELAVYQYNYLTEDQMHSELDKALSRLNVTRDDLLDVRCTWREVPDVYMGNMTTYSFDSPATGGTLSGIDVRFEGGTISIDQGGVVDIILNADVPEYAINRQYTDWVLNQYSNFIGDNPQVYAWFDRTYYGEEYYHNRFYSSTGDFSDDLFNSTVMDYFIYHMYDVVGETKKSGEGINLFYYGDGTYTEYTRLPAISHSEALWLLYNGDYYTTAPYQITMNSVVTKIEMVYKEPARNYQSMVKEGWAVPFFKIYVELPKEFNIETDNGILKHYGAYYVCAIHPDYIELTDDYIQFNGG